jgi:hypothetical protein
MTEWHCAWEERFTIHTCSRIVYGHISYKSTREFYSSNDRAIALVPGTLEPELSFPASSQITYKNTKGGTLLVGLFIPSRSRVPFFTEIGLASCLHHIPPRYVPDLQRILSVLAGNESKKSYKVVITQKQKERAIITTTALCVLYYKVPFYFYEYDRAERICSVRRLCFIYENNND